MGLIDKARMFFVKQRINELERAIARDPQGFLSNVQARREELDNLKDELARYED